METLLRLLGIEKESDQKKQEKNLILKRLKKGDEIMLKWLKSQEGMAAVEYALMAALVAGVAVAAVALFGGQVKAIFESITSIVSLPAGG
jgi:Flp pilus assembly pilin Flp